MEIDKKLHNQEKDKTISKLVSTLENEPDFSFADGFADRVMTKIENAERRADQSYLLFLSIGIMSFVILGFLGIWYALGWEAITGMRETLLYALFVAFIVGIFQALDQTFVKRKVEFT